MKPSWLEAPRFCTLGDDFYQAALSVSSWFLFGVGETNCLLAVGFTSLLRGHSLTSATKSGTLLIFTEFNRGENCESEIYTIHAKFSQSDINLAGELRYLCGIKYIEPEVWLCKELWLLFRSFIIIYG